MLPSEFLRANDRQEGLINTKKIQRLIDELVVSGRARELLQNMNYDPPTKKKERGVGFGPIGEIVLDSVSES